MIVLNFIIHIAILASISLLLYRNSLGLKPFFASALAFKIICGLGIGWLYSNYYSFGDTWAYFNEANKLVDIAYNDIGEYLNYLTTSSTDIYTSIYFKQPRALFFTKLVSVFSYITAKNYWLISCYFSLAAFSGLWLLARKLTALFPNNNFSVAFSLLFLPSAVFWSSGIIKESLSACMASLIVVQFLSWSFLKKATLKSIIIFIVSVFFLWELKYYYAAGLLAVGFVILMTQYTTEKTSLIKYGYKAAIPILLVLLITSFLIIGLIRPNIGIDNLLHPIVINNQAFVENSSLGDYIQYNELKESWISIMKNTPLAIISGLFRPFVWEVNGVLKFIYSLENLLILGLVVLRLFKLPKKLNNTEFIYALGTSLFVLIMITFLALSTPNYGTLIRYKSIVLPFLVLLLTMNHPYFQKLNEWRIWKGKLKE